MQTNQQKAPAPFEALLRALAGHRKIDRPDLWAAQIATYVGEYVHDLPLDKVRSSALVEYTLDLHHQIEGYKSFGGSYLGEVTDLPEIHAPQDEAGHAVFWDMVEGAHALLAPIGREISEERGAFSHWTAFNAPDGVCHVLPSTVMLSLYRLSDEVRQLLAN